MKTILISLVKLYQKIPGTHHNKCRYQPTCSNYMIEAVEVHGFIKGLYLGIKRILRCNPWGGYGIDKVPIKKEKNMKKKFKLLLLIFILSITVTGCKQDDMEDIEIAVTNYPNEYIITKLYKNHATIESIYPDGVDLANYKISSKQKTEFSKKGLFIYNGLIEQERDLAIELLDLNKELKIIDSAYVLESDYSPESLWLNPSSLLMMSQNIRIGLKEYVSNNYLKKEIDSNYEKLKVALSELDANYRVVVDNAKNKTILVNDSSLKFLEKFGLEVICLNDEATEKEIDNVAKLINAKSVSYIFSFEDDILTNNTKKITELFPAINVIQLHKLDNLSDKNRDENEDYMSLMKKNLELLKKELY